MEIIVGNGDMKLKVLGITEDRKMLILEAGILAKCSKEVNIQHAVDVTEKKLPIMRQEKVNGKWAWVTIGYILPTRPSIEKMKESITAHEQLKDHMMKVLQQTNYEGQGASDAEELKEHFEIAILAMSILLKETQKKKKWERAERLAAEQGKVVKMCPKCKEPTICGEWGEEKEFEGGTYLYYTRCKQCGHRFEVNRY